MLARDIAIIGRISITKGSDMLAALMFNLSIKAIAQTVHQYLHDVGSRNQAVDRETERGDDDEILNNMCWDADQSDSRGLAPSLWQVTDCRSVYEG